jgi:hypothetical protein
VMYLSGSGWLQVSLSSNATPAGLTVRPISTRPPAGTYSADVIVAAPGASNSPVKVRVTYTVAP